MIKFYIPKKEDLWFRQMFMADEETMSYNHDWGGTIPFPKERWNDWYDRWITNPAIRLFLKNGFCEEYRTKEIIMLKKELTSKEI